MRDLAAQELQQRFGDDWVRIDWESSGDALSQMLTEGLNTRCRVEFEPVSDGTYIYSRVDSQEFGADPAGPRVSDIFESFDWVRFSDEA